MKPTGRLQLMCAALGVAVASVAGGACDRAPLPLEPLSRAPRAAISDGANGGPAGFYFLSPMVPDPAVTGSFDGDLSPTVSICVLGAAGCASVLGTYDGATVPAVKMDAVDESYTLLWQTKSLSLDPTQDLRVRVTIGTLVLGYADVDVVASSKGLATVAPGTVGLVAGRPLAIRFRIETGIPGSVEVAPSASLIGVASELTLTATVRDLHGELIPEPTVTWSSTNAAVTVTSAGVAQGAAPGEASVIASAGSASAAAVITAVGPVLFISDRDGAWRFHIQTLGQAATPVGPQLTTAFNPGVWRPDGGKIAFGDAGWVYTMNADGTGLDALVPGGGPAWSPDGLRIAYYHNPGGALEGSEIYVMNADGTGVLPLTNDNPANNLDPSWSPDGTRIAFVRTRAAEGVYTIDPDGTDLVAVSSGDPQGPPSWSADGSLLTFAADASSLNPVNEIFIAQADGSGATKLTATDYEYEFYPSLSVTGRIVFSRTDGGLPGDWDLFTVGSDGSGELQITSDATTNDGHPAWSPDGRVIVFARASVIYLVKSDGTLLTPLTQGSATNATPSWKP